MPKGKPLTYKEVKEVFEKHGCRLLTDHYVNNTTPMPFICSCGKQSEIMYGRFSRSGCCKECGWKRKRASERFTFAEVKEMFVQAGFELLETDYVNILQPLRFRCHCGNEGKVRLFCLQRGQRQCRKCAYKADKHYRWNPDREEVKQRKLFIHRCGSMLRGCLKSMGLRKGDHTARLLGFTGEQLRRHITSHPDWINVKDEPWHIDHIFPIKAFLDHGIYDLRVINCLENLRPCAAKENLVKNGTYDDAIFCRWLASKKSSPK